MKSPTFSLTISHTPWRPERVRALAEMHESLGRWPDHVVASHLNDADYRGRDWQTMKVKWALDQWLFARKIGDGRLSPTETCMPATHHIFMTDDLHIAPRFWEIVTAIASANPVAIVGFLSNHPKAVSLFNKGYRMYRTNSWLVGPCYMIPHVHLVPFLEWFEGLPDGNEKGQKGYANDDSSINEWVTFHGPGEVWHPMPTCIEHRADIDSTVGHGDRFSRERVSWRTIRGHNAVGWWDAEMTGPCTGGTWPEIMADDYFWKDAFSKAPMLPVCDES